MGPLGKRGRVHPTTTLSLPLVAVNTRPGDPGTGGQEGEGRGHVNIFIPPITMLFIRGYTKWMYKVRA